MITAIALIVIVPVLVGLPLLAWRYRYGRPESTYRPNWDHSKLLEAVIWGLPATIVIVLGFMLWGESHRLDPWRAIPSDAPPVEIQAIGFDHGWLFLYPQSEGASYQELFMPVGRPVDLRLTSASVMQSPMVPRLGGQVYAMNGMQSRLHLLATKTSRIEGRNMQYDGNAFSRQRFAVSVLSSPDFAKAIRSGQPISIARLRSVVCGPDLTPRSFSRVPAGIFELFAAGNGKAIDTSSWCAPTDSNAGPAT